MEGPLQTANAFATSTAGGAGTDNAFNQDLFLVNRKFLSLAGKYHVLDGASNPICFVERPLFKIKAVFGIYSDDNKTRPLLSLRQDSLLAINMQCTLLDPNDQVIATFVRKGWMSMIRRTWIINDASGTPIAKAMEDCMWKAVLRRCVKNMNFLFRTNFVIKRPNGEQIGEFIRCWSIKDNHRLDLSADSSRTLDRRIALGIAILLDNMEPHDA